MAFKLTPSSLKELCKQHKLYTSCPELNDVLYLQCKGAEKIESLEEYTGLKTLYMESNAIRVIEGLDHLVNLRSLYLAKNIIRRMEGLQTLTLLETLDLSENAIHVVEGLSGLPNLRTLLLASNKLSKAADLQDLASCSSLVTLDLSGNQLSEPAALELVIGLPLALLKLQGNPLVSNVRHYRKVVVAGMPQLKYLDDAPVGDQDRRLAAAFMTGGLEAERSERDAIRQEAADKAEQQRRSFDEMVAAAKAAAPVPHDPMRFRAVPPGESDSDDEGLPAIYIAEKQQRRAQQRLQQQQESGIAPQQQEQQPLEAESSSASADQTARQPPHTPPEQAVDHETPEANSSMIAQRRSTAADATQDETQMHKADQQEEPKSLAAGPDHPADQQQSQDDQAEQEQTQQQQQQQQQHPNPELAQEAASDAAMSEDARRQMRASNSANAQQAPVRPMPGHNCRSRLPERFCRTMLCNMLDGPAPKLGILSSWQP
eukprot:GHUV01014990.1.p1 GENE.GHUV01014990.1~~GHUV01014990.1.p1  ORF type:complete len:487 (+),score=179.60 GHUV01014990.1:553-2013(+)